MTGKKKGDDPLDGMNFHEAMARFLQTDPKELADEFAQVKARQEEIRKNAEAKKDFIKRAARPGGKRFRL
jgi:hypothetical protein